MRRREFITLIGGAAVAWPLAVRAQQNERRQITVWISRANDVEGRRLGSALRAALEALGWVNGRNARIDYRWVTSEIDRPSLATEIVQQHPDVILAATTAAVAVLARATSTIPIVFVNLSDLIGGGFVKSLSRPGGTISGFISNEPSLGSKWPGLLNEIAPAVKRMAFIYNPDTASYAEPFLRQADAAALASGLQRKAPGQHDGSPRARRKLPPHTHAGVEELHLLDGELWINGRKLVPGDYNYGAPGALDESVWSETGSTCVLVTSTREYPPVERR